MTTTTMDLHGVSATRADRKTASGVYKRPPSASHVALVTASHYVDTARGRPPPAYYERFVHRVAWTFCAVAVAWVFGADLARWLWSLIWWPPVTSGWPSSLSVLEWPRCTRRTDLRNKIAVPSRCAGAARTTDGTGRPPARVWRPSFWRARMAGRWRRAHQIHREDFQDMTEETAREFFLLDMRYRPSASDDGDGECDGCPPPCPHTKHGAPLMVWWAPNDSGYGNSLAAPWVGRYSETRLREAGASYYQLGKLTLAIPCEAVLPFAVPRPDRFMGERGSFWCDGPGPVVINHSLMWDLLEPLAWTPEVLR